MTDGQKAIEDYPKIASAGACGINEFVMTTPFVLVSKFSWCICLHDIFRGELFLFAAKDRKSGNYQVLHGQRHYLSVFFLNSGMLRHIIRHSIYSFPFLFW